MERHVLQPEMVREAPMVTAVAGRIHLRADEVDAAAVSVVVDGLFDAVTIGVELGTGVGERVPLRRVLQEEGHLVVVPDVDELRVAPVLHLALVDVVEDVGLAVHVLRGREHGWVPSLVQGAAPRIVERKTETEGDAGLDLPHTLEDFFRGEQVDATELVVLAPVAPRRARWALLPPLGHRSCSFRSFATSSG